MSDGSIVPYRKESVIVAVNRNNYQTIIPQVIAQRKLIDNRDIGDFVGYPLEDYVKVVPHTIKLTIQYFNFREPPFTKRQGQNFVRVTLNIPDVDKAKLDWLTIKNAAGGANGYMWGRFRAVAQLSNGRQMKVYAGSEQAAEERLKALVVLGTAKILTLSISEEKAEGRRAPTKRLYKPTTRVYPAYFSVLNYQKIEVENELEFSGINATLKGNFRRQKTPKIPLWISREPQNARLLILESLRIRQTST